MKIVNKQEFYNLPIGTLYSNYGEIWFSGLKIKGETISYENVPTDYCYENLIGNILHDNSNEFVEILEDAVKNKTSFELDFDCLKRDGLYEDEMFAIYEEKDLLQLITKLQSLIK